MSGQFHYHIIDNFFGDRLYTLLPYLKSQEHYSRSDHPEYLTQESTWPGKRSLDLIKSNPAMYYLFSDCMGDFCPDQGCMTLYTHFRYNDPDSPDWIHIYQKLILTVVHVSMMQKQMEILY